MAVLKDDNDGSRHQKFIVELPNTMTVLVAHNIDLAPRIERLQKGDTVGFNGEYEYSEKGGVIHWTHHYPQQRHEGGCVKTPRKNLSVVEQFCLYVLSLSLSLSLSLLNRSMLSVQERRPTLCTKSDPVNL